MKLALALLFCLPLQALAVTYYLAPAGRDSNYGLSASYPWASPNHSLNCGDVILAAPGTYSNANFYTGKWGRVNCPAGNNVAWLKCASFDACRIYASTNQGMWVDQNYWGVQGWEVSSSASDLYGTCFLAAPNWNLKKTVHHIIFANDVANGCSQAGFATENFGGSVGVDYFAVLGSVAYNAAQGSGTCASGISVWQPAPFDTIGGTHIYIAGNFTYANLNPSRCNGTTPTDGEGIILDTFDGAQGGTNYQGQAVVENNIVAGNGGRGIEVYNNQAGTSHANIWIRQNTVYGSNYDNNQQWYGCGSLAITAAKNVHAYGNLASTGSATGCGGRSIYALSISGGDGSDTAENNFAYGYSGNNTFTWASGSFAWSSTNTLGKNPAFRNPVVPGAPQCGSATNAPACMAGMAQNFTSTATCNPTVGYAPPQPAPVADPLFPQWLCSANVPPGLVTMGCAVPAVRQALPLEQAGLARRKGQHRWAAHVR